MSNRKKYLYEVTVIQVTDDDQVLFVEPTPVMATSDETADMAGVQKALQKDPDVDVNTLCVIARPFRRG